MSVIVLKARSCNLWHEVKYKRKWWSQKKLGTQNQTKSKRILIHFAVASERIKPMMRHINITNGITMCCRRWSKVNFIGPFRKPDQITCSQCLFCFIQSLKIFDFYGHKFIEEFRRKCVRCRSICGIPNNLLKWLLDCCLFWELNEHMVWSFPNKNIFG